MVSERLDRPIRSGTSHILGLHFGEATQSCPFRVHRGWLMLHFGTVGGGKDVNCRRVPDMTSGAFSVCTSVPVQRIGRLLLPDIKHLMEAA